MLKPPQKQSIVGLYLLHVLFFFLPLIVGYVLNTTTQPTLLTLIVPLLLFWFLTLRSIPKINRAIRDARAMNLLRALYVAEKRPAPSATLLLRSFQMDNRFGDAAALNSIQQSLKTVDVVSRTGLVVPGLASLLHLRAQSRIKRGALEYQLALAAKKALRSTTLCSIGTSDDSLGFGRITTTDAAWKETASALIDHAERILMIFGPGIGTSWELDKIVMSRSFLAKTIFVVPPSASALALVSSGIYTTAGGPQARVNGMLAEQHEILAGRLAAVGCRAPDFRSGLAFGFVDGSSKQVKFTRIDRKARKEIRNLLRAVGPTPAGQPSGRKAEARQ